jgi:hypothetical protein
VVLCRVSSSVLTTVYNCLRAQATYVDNGDRFSASLPFIGCSVITQSYCRHGLEKRHLIPGCELFVLHLLVCSPHEHVSVPIYWKVTGISSEDKRIILAVLTPIVSSRSAYTLNFQSHFKIHNIR